MQKNNLADNKLSTLVSGGKPLKYFSEANELTLQGYKLPQPFLLG